MPFDSYTKSLLHFNGANNSVVFTDEIGKIWTPAGNIKIVTAESKFGGASGAFTNGNSYISTPDHADFNLAAGEFTIECWVKRNGIGSAQVIIAQCDLNGNDVGFYLQFNTTNVLQCGFTDAAGTWYSIITTETLADTTIFHHLALVRSVNTMYLYIDGTASVVTKDVTGVTARNSAQKVTIGRYGDNNSGYFSGWIDEFRFSTGIARWRSNFVPSTYQYSGLPKGSLPSTGVGI